MFSVRGDRSQSRPRAWLRQCSPTRSRGHQCHHWGLPPHGPVQSHPRSLTEAQWHSPRFPNQNLPVVSFLRQAGSTSPQPSRPAHSWLPLVASGPQGPRPCPFCPRGSSHGRPCGATIYLAICLPTWLGRFVVERTWGQSPRRERHLLGVGRLGSATMRAHKGLGGGAGHARGHGECARGPGPTDSQAP